MVTPDSTVQSGTKFETVDAAKWNGPLFTKMNCISKQYDQAGRYTTLVQALRIALLR